MKVVNENRKARYDYEILETLEAGIVLRGTEIKSVRQRKVSLEGSYAEIKGNECWLVGSNIEVYEQGNVHNHEPLRRRKLLLNKVEIVNWGVESNQRGCTIVPLKVYFNSKNIAKVELALCRGKKKHDKRASIKERDLKRAGE